MNGRGYERKRSWTNLKYYPVISLECRKPRKLSEGSVSRSIIYRKISHTIPTEPTCSVYLLFSSSEPLFRSNPRSLPQRMTALENRPQGCVIKQATGLLFYLTNVARHFLSTALAYKTPNCIQQCVYER